jgi:uncharacterized protein (DUF1499 family)
MAGQSLVTQLWRGGDSTKRSKLALSALLLTVLPTVVVLGVGYAHRTGEVSVQNGFQVLRWAAYVALIGAVLGIVAIVRSATGARKRGWGQGLLAVIIGLGFVSVPAYYYFVVLPSVPRIHDITTDTQNPPAFVAVAPLRAGYPNPPAYDGPDAAAAQKQAYPDIAPLIVSKPPADVFAAAMDVTQAMGLDIVNATPAEGRIEASKRSLFFGFVDDVVIRLQPDGAGTRIDVRSKSREGRSDFGVNAARIRKILSLLKAKVG